MDIWIVNQHLFCTTCAKWELKAGGVSALAKSEQQALGPDPCVGIPQFPHL